MHFTKISVLTFVGSILIVAALSTSAVLAYMSSPERDVPIIFSESEFLDELWYSYKKTTIEPSTYRTVDRQADNITTSEGQSYTMLRAVWMDDKRTFDHSWQWTKDNLQRNDSLFAWKFGPIGNGTYGVQINQGGQNTASDADSDIALSLLMAYRRWNDSRYLQAAKPIIHSIWEQQVVLVHDKPVLAANDLERLNKSTIVVNPSYFAPYTYKIFAKVDTAPGHAWQALADNSYSLLERTMHHSFAATAPTGLPPDWLRMDRTTGALLAPTSTNTLNYGYDAMRVPWRLAMDWQWFGDKRAYDLLKQLSFLRQQWHDQQKLLATYTPNGTVPKRYAYEAPAMYGTALAYFQVIEPGAAKQIYTMKLRKVYDPYARAAIPELSYYDANWSWFGIALYQGALPNLTE